MELAPGKVPDMIATDDFEAFSLAAASGHLPVMERLMGLAEDRVPDMIAAGDFAAFKLAHRNGHKTVTDYLLTFPSVFAYAERHQREFGDCVNPWVDNKLANLRQEKGEFERANPNAVFDVTDPEDAKLLFYVARNLIGRNNPDLLDDLRFLLDIPAVKALAHTEVTQGIPNELLRLALSAGNQGAARVLLTVPAVRELAEQNHYYQNEVRAGLDVTALARDRESSMTALSTGEQQRLQAASDRYQPMLTRRGVDDVMQELRLNLEERYRLHPAKIESQDIESQDLNLPFDWEAFSQEDLSTEQRQAALIAYYQNKDHTAWRYLSKPNPWMNPDASYVSVSLDCLHPPAPAEAPERGDAPPEPGR